MEGFLQYLPLIALFVLMIGMTVWQQRKQKKRMEELSESLKVGVKVRTAGGFIGTIVGVNGDTVYVELNPDKIKVELLKGAVAPLDEQLAPAAPVQEEPSEPENNEDNGTEE